MTEDPAPAPAAPPPRRSWATGLRTLAGPAPRSDLVAGLTVGAVVVPQSLAYAGLAGVPAVTGLAAALAALAAYALLGSSPVLSVNPTATSSILAASAGLAIGRADADRYVTALALVAVLAGGLAVAAGLGRLGFLSNLLSRPVLTGYAAGAAVIIVIGQVGALLGLDVDAHRALPALRDLARSIDHTSAATLAVGVTSLAVLLLLQRRWPRRPAALVVVTGAIVTSRLFELAEHGVRTVGVLPSGLPHLALPDLPADDTRALLLPAAALALVGFTEAVAQGRTFAHPDGAGPDANRELVALGAANAASGLCGGFAVSASFSCTALNVRAGARTRRAGAITAALVALCLVALTPVFEPLPQATLAAVVIVAVVPLVQVGTFRRLARLQRDDFLFAVAATAGTIVLGILPGLALAVALSVAGLLYRVTVAETAVLGYVPEQDAWRSLERFAEARTAPGVLVLRFAGPLYFANVARLRHEVAERVAEAGPRLRRVVLDGRAMSHLDVTALDVLTNLHGALARDGVDLVLAGLRGAALDIVLRSDLARTVGVDRLVFPTVRAATETTSPDGT